MAGRGKKVALSGGGGGGGQLNQLFAGTRGGFVWPRSSRPGKRRRRPFNGLMTKKLGPILTLEGKSDLFFLSCCLVRLYLRASVGGGGGSGEPEKAPPMWLRQVERCWRGNKWSAKSSNKLRLSLLKATLLENARKKKKERKVNLIEDEKLS